MPPPPLKATNKLVEPVAFVLVRAVAGVDRKLPNRSSKRRPEAVYGLCPSFALQPRAVPEGDSLLGRVRNRLARLLLVSAVRVAPLLPHVLWLTLEAAVEWSWPWPLPDAYLAVSLCRVRVQHGPFLQPWLVGVRPEEVEESLVRERGRLSGRRKL